ncbi:hypothetical protein A2U01_0064011, partial [Trifolium medium]|nr:hypothetical protein [Trifolium medium]
DMAIMDADGAGEDR